MGATLAQLLAVRSRRTEAAIKFLTDMERELARNRLLDRVKISLEDLREPLRVVPYEPGREVSAFDARDALRFQSELRRSGNEPDPYPTIYAFAGGATGESQPQSLDDLEPDLQIAVIIGDTGSGKSEWLKNLARSCAKQALAKLESFTACLDEVDFPIFLHAECTAGQLDAAKRFQEKPAAWMDGAPNPPLSAPEFLGAAMLVGAARAGGLPKSLAAYVWKRITQASGGPRLLFCLDGWDRVPRTARTDIKAGLTALAERNTILMFLTSRTSGYTRPLPVERTTKGKRCELQVLPLEPRQARAFADKLLNSIGAPVSLDDLIRMPSPALAGMMQNPLLVTLICLAFARGFSEWDYPQLKLPSSRVNIYERILEGLLTIWRESDHEDPPLSEVTQAKLTLLPHLAERYFHKTCIERPDFYEFLWGSGGKKGYMSGRHPSDPLRIVVRLDDQQTLEAELANRDGVLVPCGGGNLGNYMFLHLTIQEYLTACALAIRAKKGKSFNFKSFIDKNAGLPGWHEVIVLLACKLLEPERSKLLSQLLKNDDIRRCGLKLATECDAELRGQ